MTSRHPSLTHEKEFIFNITVVCYDFTGMYDIQNAHTTILSNTALQNMSDARDFKLGRIKFLCVSQLYYCLLRLQERDYSVPTTEHIHIEWFGHPTSVIFDHGFVDAYVWTPHFISRLLAKTLRLHLTRSRRGWPRNE